MRKFRRKDSKTPIVLMGYYNPIHAYGTARFAKDAAEAGVDGLITVDLPPEEDEVLRLPAAAQALDIVRLATPTTDEARLSAVLTGASGFIYYVSIAGVTGTKSFAEDDVRAAVARLQSAGKLPCAVGFGIERRSRPPPLPVLPTQRWSVPPSSSGSPRVPAAKKPNLSAML